MKLNERVVIKDEVLNKEFYSGIKIRKKSQKIFRIDYFMPRTNRQVAKLKNDNGSLGTRFVYIKDLEKVN